VALTDVFDRNRDLRNSFRHDTITLPVHNIMNIVTEPAKFLLPVIAVVTSKSESAWQNRSPQNCTMWYYMMN